MLLDRTKFMIDKICTGKGERNVTERREKNGESWMNTLSEQKKSPIALLHFNSVDLPATGTDLV
jgi:hypothetical protein